MLVQFKPKIDVKWDWDVRPELPELPDGMLYDKETLRPSVECSQCGRWFEWPLDVAEYDPDVQENHYCGGSPRCCP